MICYEPIFLEHVTTYPILTSLNSVSIRLVGTRFLKKYIPNIQGVFPPAYGQGAPGTASTMEFNMTPPQDSGKEEMGDQFKGKGTPSSVLGLAVATLVRIHTCAHT